MCLKTYIVIYNRYVFIPMLSYRDLIDFTIKHLDENESNVDS